MKGSGMSSRDRSISVNKSTIKSLKL